MYEKPRQNVHVRTIFHLHLHNSNDFAEIEYTFLNQEAEYLNSESLSSYLFLAKSSVLPTSFQGKLKSLGEERWTIGGSF